MNSTEKFAPKFHTECFYSGDRSYFIDLMPTKLNELCIRMAIGKACGESTKYARIILFEKDMQNFINAFAGIIQEYMNIKSKQR